jgi:poly(A) polymerase Pap1
VVGYVSGVMHYLVVAVLIKLRPNKRTVQKLNQFFYTANHRLMAQDIWIVTFGKKLISGKEGWKF